MADKPREAVLADYVRILLFHYENCKDLSEFGPYLEQCGEDPVKVLVEIASILDHIWQSRICPMCEANEDQHLLGCPKGSGSLRDYMMFQAGFTLARSGEGLGNRTNPSLSLGYKRGLEEPTPESEKGAGTL